MNNHALNGLNPKKNPLHANIRVKQKKKKKKKKERIGMIQLTT